MKTSDTGIVLSGVVVGILLGAGSLLYMNGGTLGASTNDVSYQRLRPRDIVEQQLKAHEAKTAGQNVQKMENTAVVPSDDCTKTTVAIKELMTKVNYWVPNNIKNTQSRTEIQKAADTIIARACPAPEPTSMKKDTAPMKAAAPTVKVDNDCEQFERGSTRYEKCRANTQENKTYEPIQY